MESELFSFAACHLWLQGENQNNEKEKSKKEKTELKCTHIVCWQATGRNKGPPIVARKLFIKCNLNSREKNLYRIKLHQSYPAILKKGFSGIFQLKSDWLIGLKRPKPSLPNIKDLNLFPLADRGSTVYNHLS